MASYTVRTGAYSFSPDDSLGKGSFAEVFKGTRESDGLVVAVKRIHKTRLKSNSYRKLLDSEIAILQELKHPHMVELYDHVETEKHICLIFQFCNGGDLNDYIGKNAPMGERMVGELARQISLAMEYLHNRNIVHRDLKPQNILVHTEKNRNGTPSATIFKFADFGFARHLNMDMAETFCGSPLYMAPEVLYGGLYDARSDLWSIGIILYQCMTKHPPYRAKSIEALKKVLSKPDAGKIKYPVGTSTSLSHLVSGLLQIKPAKRISFPAFFKHPFFSDRDKDEASIGMYDGDVIEGSENPPKGVPYGNAPATPSPGNSVASSHSMDDFDHIGTRLSGKQGSTHLAKVQGSDASVDDHSYIILDKQHVELNEIADELETGRPWTANPTFSPSMPESNPLNAAVSKLTRGALKSLTGTSPTDHALTRPSRLTQRMTAPATLRSESPSSRDIEAFVTTVERATKPAGAVMLVAKSHAAGPEPGMQDTVRRIEALHLYNKALKFLRRGMGDLRIAVDACHGLLTNRRSKEAVQVLRDRFNNCVNAIEALRRSIPSGTGLTQYRGVPVAASEELLYQYAVNLCPEAAKHESMGDKTTCEVLYRRVLIIFNLLLEDALQEDKPILQRYATSTRRRLEKVVLGRDFPSSQAQQHSTHQSNHANYVNDVDQEISKETVGSPYSSHQKRIEPNSSTQYYTNSSTRDEIINPSPGVFVSPNVQHVCEAHSVVSPPSRFRTDVPSGLRSALVRSRHLTSNSPHSPASLMSNSTTGSGSWECRSISSNSHALSFDYNVSPEPAPGHSTPPRHLNRSPLPPQTPSNTNAGITTSSFSQQCQICGGTLTPGKPFCPECGSPSKIIPRDNRPMIGSLDLSPGSQGTHINDLLETSRKNEDLRQHSDASAEAFIFNPPQQTIRVRATSDTLTARHAAQRVANSRRTEIRNTNATGHGASDIEPVSMRSVDDTWDTSAPQKKLPDVIDPVGAVSREMALEQMELLRTQLAALESKVSQT